MKIFVTGATGFIGSNFTNKALQEGNEVLALRRSDSSRTRVPLISEPIWLTKQLNEVSVQDLSGVDVVVHFAAHSMQPPYDTVENCNYWNVTAPLQLFNKAISAGVERFIVAGSCFEYGSSGERYQFIPANAPLLPTVTYAISKAEASRKFIQLAKDENLKLSIQRIFHVYGPGESENRLWPSLKKASESGQNFSMTFGEQIRDFIYVDKVVDRFYELCNDNLIEKGKPLVQNLGTGAPMSILEFSKLWWKRWNAKGKLLVGEIPYRTNEVMRYVPKI